MKYCTYIGIDPGKKGGIAVIYPDGDIFCMEMPTNANNEIDSKEIYEIMPIEHSFCCIEKSSAMPGQGVKSMFSYGKGYGKLLAALEILQIPYEEVHPRKWKKMFSLNNDKKRSVATAEKLFPEWKGKFVTPRGRLMDGKAEAILLALYAKRINEGKN